MMQLLVPERYGKRTKVDVFPLVRAVARRRWVKNRNVCFEDLLGDTLLACIKAKKRYNREGTKFSTYVYQRLQFAALDSSAGEAAYQHHHVLTDDPYSEQVRNEDSDEIPAGRINLDAYSDLEEETDRARTMRRVAHVIDYVLPRIEAYVVVAHYMRGLTLRQIAATLGTREAIVANVLARALHNIRRRLQVDGFIGFNRV